MDKSRKPTYHRHPRVPLEWSAALDRQLVRASTIPVCTQPVNVLYVTSKVTYVLILVGWQSVCTADQNVHHWLGRARGKRVHTVLKLVQHLGLHNRQCNKFKTGANFHISPISVATSLTSLELFNRYSATRTKWQKLEGHANRMYESTVGQARLTEGIQLPPLT
jgi:hypothetical protein